MSTIPSLSVWSSIKIPLTGYYAKSWNEVKSPVPYVGSWRQRKEKSNSETREVVNLRVPSPLRKGKENVLSQTSCACQAYHNKRDFHKPKNISCLCIPDIHRANTEFLGKWPSNHYHRLNYQDSYEDLYLNSDGYLTDSDTEMELKFIPSVKPWTSEELQMLNKRYHLVEEKAKTPTNKIKKHKRRVKSTKSEQAALTVPKTSCLDSLKSSYKSHSQNFCKKEYDIADLLSSNESFGLEFLGYSDDSIVSRRQNSFPPAKPTGRNYYETKLAELYMIELGIKR